MVPHIYNDVGQIDIVSDSFRITPKITDQKIPENKA